MFSARRPKEALWFFTQAKHCCLSRGVIDIYSFQPLRFWQVVVRQPLQQFTVNRPQPEQALSCRNRGRFTCSNGDTAEQVSALFVRQTVELLRDNVGAEGIESQKQRENLVPFWPSIKMQQDWLEGIGGSFRILLKAPTVMALIFQVAVWLLGMVSMAASALKTPTCPLVLQVSTMTTSSLPCICCPLSCSSPDSYLLKSMRYLDEMFRLQMSSMSAQSWYLTFPKEQIEKQTVTSWGSEREALSNRTTQVQKLVWSHSWVLWVSLGQVQQTQLDFWKCTLRQMLMRVLGFMSRVSINIFLVALKVTLQQLQVSASCCVSQLDMSAMLVMVGSCWPRAIASTMSSTTTFTIWNRYQYLLVALQFNPPAHSLNYTTHSALEQRAVTLVSIYYCYYIRVILILLEQMATFKLTNLNLQVDVPLFTASSKKILKIQITDSKTPTSIKVPHVAQYVSPTSLIWEDTVILPAKFDKSFPFSILSQSQQFSTNPQHFQTAMEGAITIKKDEGNYSGWQLAMGHKKVGYLFGNIEYINKLGHKKQLIINSDNSSSFFFNTISLQKDNVAITSIYAFFHNLTTNNKQRVFFQFQLGNVSERSAIKRIRNQEYRSFQILQLRHSHPSITKVTVQGFVFDSADNRTIKIGVGETQLLIGPEPNSVSNSLQLAERIKLERIFLYDDQSREIGWVSFKYIKANDQSLDPRFFLQDKFNTIGDINFRPLNHSRLTISQLRGQYNLKSPLQSNSNIFVPLSSRFQDPAKRKKNDRIGLGHSTIDIKELPSTSRYQVAAFGFGKKLASVERDVSIPGVGRYQLPALFDRFK